MTKVVFSNVMYPIHVVVMKRENQKNLKPKSDQLYVNLTRRLWEKKGDCMAVAEGVQLKSVIRCNP